MSTKDLYVCVMFDFMSSALWHRSGVEMEEEYIPLPTNVIELLEDLRIKYDIDPHHEAPLIDDNADDIEAEYCRAAYEIAKQIKAALPEWEVEFFNWSYGSKAALPVDLPVNQNSRSAV